MIDIESEIERMQTALKTFAALNAEERRNSENLDPETLELVKELRQIFRAVRVLEDGSIAAVGHLMTTTAVHLGMSRHGWETRFCYEDPHKAFEVLASLKSEDDVPEGWVSSRPKRPQYVPITPGGTPCFWLTSNSRDEAWSKLLRDTEHVPYDSIGELQDRGYRVEPLPC